MHDSLEIVDELMLLISESLHLHQPGGPSHQLLSMATKELLRFRLRCLRKSGAFKVAVVGLGNVGKSTLINALLGDEIAPVRNGPCTASVVEFKYGQEYRIEASAETLLPDVWDFQSAAPMHQKLCEMVDHASSESQAWSRLVVTLPALLLEDGLSLVDTPGFGAAGDVGLKDNDAVARFLREDVAQIFWVVMADQGIMANEHRFYRTLLAERCDDLIVTNADDWNEEDCSRWEARYRRHLSRQSRVHFVSGKEGRRARHGGNLAAWEESGMGDLEARIRQLASAPNRVDAVTTRIGHLGAALVERFSGPDFKRFFQPLLSPTAAAAFRIRYHGATWMAAWETLMTAS